MTAPTIVGLCGSLREQSTTRAALKRSLDAAATAGAHTQRLDLREYEVPIYDGDESAAGDISELRAEIRSADGLLLATPVYHASYSSALKAALDHCRRADIEDTTVGLLATAGGPFYGPVFSHLRAVVQILDGWVLPDQVAIPEASEVIVDGRVTEAEYARRLERLGEGVAAYAGLDRLPELAAEQAVLAQG